MDVSWGCFILSVRHWKWGHYKLPSRIKPAFCLFVCFYWAHIKVPPPHELGVAVQQTITKYILYHHVCWKRKQWKWGKAPSSSPCLCVSVSGELCEKHKCSFILAPVLVASNGWGCALFCSRVSFWILRVLSLDREASDDFSTKSEENHSDSVCCKLHTGRRAEPL